LREEISEHFGIQCTRKEIIFKEILEKAVSSFVTENFPEFKLEFFMELKVPTVYCLYISSYTQYFYVSSFISKLEKHAPVI